MIKALKILIEIIGWITIAGGTTLAFGGISFIVYSKWENEIMALVILIIGFVIGAIWATRILMKHGTMEWLSQIRRISKHIKASYLFSIITTQSKSDFSKWTIHI